jgi:hypothetical protein
MPLESLCLPQAVHAFSALSQQAPGKSETVSGAYTSAVYRGESQGSALVYVGVSEGRDSVGKGVCFDWCGRRFGEGLAEPEWLCWESSTSSVRVRKRHRTSMSCRPIEGLNVRRLGTYICAFRHSYTFKFEGTRAELRQSPRPVHSLAAASATNVLSSSRSMTLIASLVYMTCIQMVPAAFWRNIGKEPALC